MQKMKTVKVEDIQKKLSGLQGSWDNDIKSLVIQIFDLLVGISGDEDLGYLASYEGCDSHDYETFILPLAGGEPQERVAQCKASILSDLKCLYAEIKTWKINRSLVEKGKYLQEKSKGKKPLKVVLIPLGIILLAAFVLSVLEWCGKVSIVSETFSIGGCVGLVDLIIGIGALMYELCDDAKDRAVCEKETPEEVKAESKKRVGSYFSASIKNFFVIQDFFHIGPSTHITVNGETHPDSMKSKHKDDDA